MTMLTLFLLWLIVGLALVIVILRRALDEANRTIELQYRRIWDVHRKPHPRPERDREWGPSRN